MSSNWTLVGLALALLSIIISAIRRSRFYRVIGLISLLSMASICGGIFLAAINAESDARLLLATLGIGLLSFLAGLIGWQIERRKPDFKAEHSANPLLMGLGIFALVCAVILPTLPAELTLATPRLPPTASPTAMRTLAPTRTPRETVTSTPIPSLTFTPTPIATLTDTPTREPLSLPTSIEPTATLTPTQSDCILTVKTNPNGGVNLRKTPSSTGSVLISIPVGEKLTPTARSEDKMWWAVRYNGNDGWVSDSVVSPSVGCK